MPDTSYKRDQVVQIIGSVVDRMARKPGSDNHLLSEISRLQNVIEDMRQELNLYHPDGIQSHIPSATDELDAIVSTTEEATNAIMEACENIQLHIHDQPADQSAPIEGEIIRIIEACTFQDLTGQRITKIIRSLKEIDRCARELTQVLQERFADMEPRNIESAPVSDDQALMNGPQLAGNAISQEEIDRLLSDFK
jgi:chemotaxis protein CheZ